MAQTLEQLLVRIDATTEGLRRELAKADASVSKTAMSVDKATRMIEARFAGLGKNVLATAGILGSAAIFHKFIENTSEAEFAMSQLEAVLESTGHAAGLTSGELQRLAAQLQKTTIYGDDAVIMAEALLLTFTKISREVFPEAVKLTLDLATRMGTDLKTAALQVGKALNGSAVGLSLLSKSGITFDKEQVKLIKRLQETGEMSKAQGIIIDELNVKFKYAATTARDTLPGALKALGNAFGDLFEVTGGGGLLVDTINSLTETFAFLGDTIKIARGDLDSLSTSFISSSLDRVVEKMKALQEEMNDLVDGKRKLILPEEIARAILLSKELDTMRKMYKNLFEELAKRSAPAEAGIGKVADATSEADIKMQEFKESIEESIEQLQRLNAANDNSAASYEELKRQIDAENEVNKKGLELNDEQEKQLKALIVRREQLKDQIERTTKFREEEAKKAEKQQEAIVDALLKPWENAVQSLQSRFADMLADGKFTFESIAEIGKRAAAEVIAAWTFQNLMKTGLSAGSTFSSPGSASASGGIGGFVNNIGGSLAGNFLASTGIGQSINLAAAGALPSLFGAGFVGPPTAAMAGGMGLAATSVLGPAAIAAAFALPALFGGSRPHPASTFSGMAGAGGLKDLDVRSKHIDKTFANQTASLVSGIIQSLGKMGLNVSGNVAGGVDDGKGVLGFLFPGASGLKDVAKGDRAVSFDPEDQASFESAVAAFTVILAQTDDAMSMFADNLKLIGTEGRSADEVLNDIAFILNFDSIQQAPRVLSEVEASIAAVKEQFAIAAETASRLGLEVEKVNDAEQRRLNDILRVTTQGIAQDILGIASPVELQRLQERMRFEQQMRDLDVLGASQKEIQQAELLHNLKMQQILQQNNIEEDGILSAEKERLRVANDLVSRFGRLSGTFSNILFDLTNGRFSPLTPVENLASLRQQVSTLGMSARLGDVDAAEKLAELLPIFVELSGQVNGWNTEFEQDRQLAEDLARQTIDVADRQVELQTRIAETAQAQLNAITTGFAALQAAIEALGLSISVSDIVNAAENRNFGVMTEMNRLLAAAFPEFTGDFGGGRFNEWLARHPENTAEANAIRAQFGVGPGFATGGLVTGAQGVDMIPARLSNNEFVMRAAAVRSIGVNQLHMMNNTGRMGGDSQGVIAAINGLARLVAASGNMTNEQLDRLNKEMYTLASNAKLVAAN